MVTIDPTLQPFIAHSYFLLFPLMIVEGTGITVIAGVLVSLGVINFWLILMAAAVAALIGDVLHYAFGYWAHTKYLQKWMTRHGMTHKRFNRMERAFEKILGRF